MTPVKRKFEGGCVTVKPAGVVSGFSMVQNMRMTHPGHEQRKGQARLHTTADSTNYPVSEFQFTDKAGNQHFIAQMSDGDFLKATNAPPTVTTGVFGSELFSGSAGTRPASYAVVDDMLFFSNGADQHQVWVGEDRPVEDFIVVKDSGALPAVPDTGEDYSREVSDGRASTVAVLDSLNTYANGHCFLVRTAVPKVKQFDFTVTAANGNTATIAVKKWNGAWTEIVGSQYVLSGTYQWTASGSGTNEYYMEANGGGDPSVSEPSTLMEDGTPMTVGTLGSLAAGEYNYGDNDTLGYSTIYVRLSDGADPDSKADGYVSSGVTDATQSSDKTLAQTGAISFTAPTDVIPKYAFDQSGFWWLFEVSAQLDAEVEISEVTYEADPQDIFNLWDSTPLPAIEAMVYIDSDGTYKTYDYSSVTISELTASDKIYFRTVDKIEAVYLDVGSTPNTTATTAIDGFGYWDGDQWQEGAPSNDGTSGASKSGWIIVGRQDSAQPTQFQNTVGYGYWWYITVDKTLSADLTISIEVMPYFDIDNFGHIGYTCCGWKERLAATFNQYPKDIYVSLKGNPFCFNDSTGNNNAPILQPGDGRPNETTCLLAFHNELMVFQEEDDTMGGCVTLYQGDSGPTWGPQILSTNLGTFNSHSAKIVEGSFTSLSTTRPVTKLVYFISRIGIFACDGQAFSGVSDDVQNYFDPKESECLRVGYENRHWLGHDTSYNVLLVGIVSGSSATVPNIFLVYDLSDRTGRPWSFDSREQAITCFTEVSAGSGNVPVLQVGGAAGYVMRLNTGTNDVSTAIDSYSTMELNADGEDITLSGLLLRMKVQAAGNVTLTSYKNGNANTAVTASMTAVVANEVLRKANLPVNVSDHHISLKFQNSTASQELHLLDAILQVDGVGT